MTWCACFGEMRGLSAADVEQSTKYGNNWRAEDEEIHRESGVACGRCVAQHLNDFLKACAIATLLDEVVVVGLFHQFDKLRAIDALLEDVGHMSVVDKLEINKGCNAYPNTCIKYAKKGVRKAAGEREAEIGGNCSAKSSGEENGKYGKVECEHHIERGEQRGTQTCDEDGKGEYAVDAKDDAILHGKCIGLLEVNLPLLFYFFGCHVEKFVVLEVVSDVWAIFFRSCREFE